MILEPGSFFKLSAFYRACWGHAIKPLGDLGSEGNA
jgi:hypothetical protein